MPPEPTVFVVDDDEAVCRFLRWLMTSHGFRVKTYASAEEFLDAYEPGQPGCLVLDVRMTGMSGLELQKEMAAREPRLPIIIITGHGDVQMAVQALKIGAFDFIEKPFDYEVFLDQVRTAVDESVRIHDEDARRAETTKRLQLLTPRERQVMEMIAAGETNRSIAFHLGLSEKTVEAHRAKVMQKMQADSLADLIRKVRQRESG